MRSVDFPGIIAAAAVSTLGVLSLIVLGVGLLAWAFFKGSGEGVKIGVFASILIAAVGFGAATIRESRAYGGGEAPATGEMATGGTPTEPVSLPAEPVSQPPAPAPSSPTRDVTSKLDTTSPSADPLSFWEDSFGFTHAVTTSGSRTQGMIYKGNVRAGFTHGTISGSNVQFHFVNFVTNSEGDCSALVTPDGTRMDGTCSSQTGPFPFHSERRR